MEQPFLDQVDFSKMDGLVPAVVVDHRTHAVLMLGFMNKEAVQKTIQDKKVTFFSRTKNRLWQKGEESGNVLHVESLELDCDQDTLLIQAIPEGNTCHTGAYSCFSSQCERKPGDVLLQLMDIIQTRKKEMPEKSYTVRLFQKGMPRIAQKVGEEAVELAIAGQLPDTERCVEEASDLLYHVLVFLAARDIPFSAIEKELEKRMQ